MPLVCNLLLPVFHLSIRFNFAPSLQGRITSLGLVSMARCTPGVLARQVCGDVPRVLSTSIHLSFLGTLGRKIVERRILNGTRPDQLHLRKIVAIGSGWYHSFAVDVDGDVFAWGLNQYGQLGIEVPDPSHGDNSNVIWTPTEIPELSPSALGGARVVQIDGGEHHTLFLLSDGRVFGTGRIDSSQLGLPADHPAINEAKKNEKDYVAPPTRISFPPSPTKDEPNPVLPPYSESAEKEIKNPISKISVSGRGNLVISEAGYAYSWGYGASCQVHFIFGISRGFS
jgi:regulator of chromosome condensation